jgi:exoribonuclease R
MVHIPGILVLGLTNYGKFKGNYYYYKCYLENKECVLVPYSTENLLKNFNKMRINKYVIVDYDSKRIVETIGSVNDLDAYCKYCTKVTLFKYPFRFQIPEGNKNNHDQQDLKDLKDIDIFTIDPEGSLDLDDAFAINDNKLYVLIANVPLANDSVDFRVDFSMVSSIYYPKNVIHMIKDFKKYSLLADDAFKYVLCLEIDLKTKVHKLYNSKIKITENLRYDDNHSKISELISLTSELNKNHKKLLASITDSHQAIEYLMIYFGIYCAGVLKDSKCGIFRIVEDQQQQHQQQQQQESNDIIVTDPEIIEVKRIFTEYQSASYTTECIINKQFGDYYVHITSPIRRVVDCINIYLINCILLLSGAEIDLCYSELLESISEQTRFIKKIQKKTHLLNALIINGTEKVYSGIITEIVDNKFSIYIPELKYVFDFDDSGFDADDDVELYSKHKFKIYLFENKTNFKQKIKLMLV